MVSNVQLTPDGVRYLHADPPKPYHLRWLVPSLASNRAAAWRFYTYSGVILTAVGVWGMSPGWQGVAAAAIVLSLPMVRFNLTHPVLVDSFALGLTCVAATLWMHGALGAAVGVTLLAAATKETSPVFAAIFAWTPWLLIGLIVPLITYLIRKPGLDPIDDAHSWVLQHPIKAGKEFHHRWLVNADPRLVTPWGASVVALGAPTWQLLVAVAVGYAQLLVATDSVRLYQWAAPVVAIAATTAVSWQWWPLLIVLTLFNPLRGDGV